MSGVRQADPRRLVGALAFAGLVACQPDDLAIALAGASASPGSASSIAVVSDTPVLEASDLGDGHYSHILSAAYFVADGMRHAYVVGFADERGDEEVFHATLIRRPRVGNRRGSAVRAARPGAEPAGPIPGSVIQADDGTWVMYLWGVPAEAFSGGVIYRATAPSPAGPWVADPEPVLPLGEPGAWDDAGLDFPAVVPWVAAT